MNKNLIYLLLMFILFVRQFAAIFISSYFAVKHKSNSKAYSVKKQIIYSSSSAVLFYYVFSTIALYLLFALIFNFEFSLAIILSACLLHGLLFCICGLIGIGNFVEKFLNWKTNKHVKNIKTKKEKNHEFCGYQDYQTNASQLKSHHLFKSSES